jgi:hypothetical protein
MVIAFAATCVAEAQPPRKKPPPTALQGFATKQPAVTNVPNAGAQFWKPTHVEGIEGMQVVPKPTHVEGIEGMQVVPNPTHVEGIDGMHPVNPKPPVPHEIVSVMGALVPLPPGPAAVADIVAIPLKTNGVKLVVAIPPKTLAGFGEKVPCPEANVTVVGSGIAGLVSMTDALRVVGPQAANPGLLRVITGIASAVRLPVPVRSDRLMSASARPVAAKTLGIARNMGFLPLSARGPACRDCIDRRQRGATAISHFISVAREQTAQLTLRSPKSRLTKLSVLPVAKD